MSLVLASAPLWCKHMLRTIQVQSGASVSRRWTLLGLSVSLTVGAKTGRGIVLRRSPSPGHTGTNIKISQLWKSPASLVDGSKRSPD